MKNCFEQGARIVADSNVAAIEVASTEEICINCNLNFPIYTWKAVMESTQVSLHIPNYSSSMLNLSNAYF